MNSNANTPASRLYIFFWGTLFLLGVLYRQSNVGGEGLALPFNSTSWIAMALVMAAGLFAVGANCVLRWSALDLWFAGAFVCLLLPWLWSESPWRDTALDRYLVVIAFWLILASYRQFTLEPNQKTALLFVLILGGFLQSLICLAQFFTPDSFSWFAGIRPRGTFQQTNLVSTFIGTTMLVALYLQSRRDSPRGSDYFLYATLLTGALAMTLILSRTGIVGTVLGLLCMTALQGARACFKSWTAVIAGTLIAAVMLGSAEDGGREGVEKVGLRGTLYPVSAELFAEKPLSGWGIGTFQHTYTERLAHHYSLGSDYDYHWTAMSHPHNELLFWGVEGGLLPVLGLMTIALWYSFVVWRRGDVSHKAMWIAALPIVLHTQTELPLYLSAPHLALLALLLALGDPSEQKNLQLRSGNLFKFAGFALPVVTIAFMVSNLHTLKMLYEIPDDPSALNRIVNPMGQQKRINELMSQVLSANENADARALAVDMASQEALLRPSTGSYRILANVLRANEQTQEAAEVERHARYLFPNHPAFIESEQQPEIRAEQRSQSDTD